MTKFYNQFKQRFKSSNTIMRLIIINVVVFLVMNLLAIFLKLFNLDASAVSYYLSVPSDLQALLTRFWTPISYMFYHKQFFHILFNMLMLFWFGQIFSLYHSDKQLLELYFFGGLMGALFYVAGYNIFPFYHSVSRISILMGASGSILALIVAAAMRAPNMEVRLLLLGRVKLMWIAFAMVLLSLFGLTSANAGGELAHLGGAFAGYLFVSFDKKGKNITRFIGIVIDFFVNLFRPRPKKKTTKFHAQKLSPEEYNQKKAADAREIDRILDKIKLSGYESLTAEEKRKLFEQKQ